MARSETGKLGLVKRQEAAAEFWAVEAEGRDELIKLIERVFAVFGEIYEVDAIDGGLDRAGRRIVAGVLSLGANVIEVAIAARSRDGVIPFR